MLIGGIRIADAGQNLERTEEHAPYRDGERYEVSAACAMSPRPDRCPHATGRHHTDGAQITDEPHAAAGRIGPKGHGDSDGERQRESREDAERRRRSRFRRCGRRGASSPSYSSPSAFCRALRLFLRRRWHQRLVRQRRQLFVDLRQLFLPIAIGWRGDHQLTLSLVRP